ncbi:MAG: outer membrane lipoprotein-sorting protein [Planctomycetota bacterium]|jgi:hypothetical protein
MKSALAFTLFLLLLAPPSGAEERGGDDLVKNLLQRADRLYRSETSQATVRMEIQTPHWKRTLRFEITTEGMEKTLIRILAPKKDRGISTLRVKREMWNYFPRINKVIKVPPSMMMGAWMGSDFTNDDLVKESTLLDDYTGRMLEGDQAFHHIELTPKTDAISVWGRITMKMHKKHLLLHEQVFYDERGRKVRTLTFDAIAPLGNRTLPTRLTLTPHTKTDYRTVLTYEEASFDHALGKNTFSRRNLKKRLR